MIKLLELIPITKSVYTPESLSYFSTKNASRGDLVKISLRKKETFALVENSKDVLEEKAGLKKTGFKLKPITSVVSEKYFTQDWFNILNTISHEYLIPPTYLLASLIPKALLSSSTKKTKQTEVEKVHKKFALKGAFEDRMRDLRAITREHFARKKSLMILAPKIDSLVKLERELGKGIEQYTYIFSSELSAKKYLTQFNKAITEEHPVLIIGTPQILFFDNSELETIVIEEEGSKFWRDKNFFSIDLRKIIARAAEIRNLKLIYSDQILQIETIYQAERGFIESKNIPAGRIQSSVESKMIQIIKNKEENLPAQAEKFSWISKELEEEIKESISKKEKILLFVNRKGYSSFTLCQDCSTPQTCPNCSIPLTLHGERKDRKFLCHHCLKIQEVPQYCESCGSWRLKDFGLGIEKIEEEFHKKFKDVPYTRLDKETQKNVSKIEEVAIATEIIFSKEREKFDLLAVISIDYLFSIPDFRINESIFRLITELKSRADKKFIIQTRLGENKTIKDAISGNVSSFYQDEIESRKNFGYPPFTRLVKLSKEHKNLKQLKEEEERLLVLLKEYNPVSFPAFYEKIKGLYRWNILLKVPNIDDKLIKTLENIGKIWQISIDPESII